MIRLSARLFVILALSSAAHLAFAGNVFAPFSLDSASVMPKGIRSFRVLGFSTEVDDRWNGFGGYEGLASRFNKQISYGELVDALSTDERAQLKGYLLSKDVSMADSVGTARGVVNSRLTTTVPVLAYGVTERFTAAVIVPILYTNTNVSTGWAPSEGFQGKLDGLSAEGKHNQKLSFESRLQNVISTKLAGYGYRPLESERRQELGDVTLGGKYLVHKTDDFAVAVSSKLVLPTGRQSSVEKLIDIAPGDGQTDIGVGAMAEWQATGRISFMSSVSATHQLPSHRPKRVPIIEGEAPTPHVDYDVEEKLGDIFGGTIGSRYRFSDPWSVGAQYVFQYKEPDRYSGSAFEAQRYGWMSFETEQELQSAQAALTFSTVPLYKAKRFAVPLETTLTYVASLGGRNTSKAELVAWELALFF